MHPTHAIALFLAGLAAGTLNAIAGGGSFISFPTLMFTGVPAVEANATNTVGLWPGLAASGVAYFRLLKVPARLLAPVLATSILGGLGGALMLLNTPQHTFQHLIPYLMLFATLLFMFGPRLRVMAGHAAVVEDLDRLSWRAITAFSLANLAVSIYGGYFGAGIGFMALALLAALGLHDVHTMNALRTVTAAVINAAAVITFIAAGAVYWPQCVVMIVGSLSGGWFGARFTQRADPAKVRQAIIGLGLVLSAYFFFKTR
ncbi:MAG TPA: sulfite exporter TauE/SafE family protein [Terriglobales bacterium]|nr:sulfite exporter TauE/SafE family protein [Terriglobales bacterium]